MGVLAMVQDGRGCEEGVYEGGGCEEGVMREGFVREGVLKEAVYCASKDSG